jgi:TonB-linked SusC/RagA family outer membrane protein
MLKNLLPNLQQKKKVLIFIFFLFFSLFSFAQQKIIVNGIVFNENNVPMPGVSVNLKGTTVGTTTDADGKFSIQVNKGAILDFSYVGMKTQQVKIQDRTNFNIIMQEDLVALDEVVVIGYGEVKKSDLTGSVSYVNSKNINRTPTYDLLAALQGQVSGVNIQQRTGAPGAVNMIRIRGANSLSRNSNDPLYVVDGMILSRIGTDITTNDVQSIQILKDASATAIYGSRGANGVIIITTKRGTTGKPQVSYDAYVGVHNIIKKLEFLNADEYKDYYKKSRQNATTNTVIDPNIINSTSNTDWIDEVYRQGLSNNHTISVRGGSNQSKYYTSINYFNQKGVIRNTDYKRFSLRFNGDQLISNKLQLSENILLAYTKTNGIFADETVSNGVAWARPTQPVLDANGKPTFVQLPFPRTNPRSLVDAVINQSIGYRIVANMALDYKITNGLVAKFNVGTETNLGGSNNYVPLTLSESSFRGSAGKGYNSTVSWINENTLNYTTFINKDNHINAVAGVTFQDTKSDGLSGSSTGYVIDGFQYNNLAAGTTQSSSSSYAKFSLLSYLGRVDYAYKEKVLLTLSGRYDGSSRLAEGHKYNFFPSAALAWKISEEKFLQNNKTISELKLRGSWGKTGSQSVAPYSSFAALGVTNVYPSGGTTPSIGYIPATVANENLTWETTDQINFGVDLGLFNDRIQFTGEFYKKNTKGLLFSRLTPPSSGYSSAIQNIGEVENKGLEFLIRSRNFSGAFDWSTTFNLTLNRAKVLDLGKNPAGQPVLQINTSEGVGWFPIIVGKVPFQPYGYFIDNVNLQTGKYTYKDLNKDGVVDAKDQDVIGNFQPKYIFGLINDFSYKNFDLSIFLQGSVGNDVFLDAYRHGLALNGNNNILKSIYNGVGTIYPIPNADYGTSAGGNTPAIIFDGTYVRVKDLTLGYTFPTTTNKAPFSSLRVYVSGSNLITFDKNYPWYDPEVSAGDDVITGWDRGGYANNKSVIFGLKVTF